MKMKKTKKISKFEYPTKYCTQLINPPRRNKKYYSDKVESFYLCRLNNNPCIASHLGECGKDESGFELFTPYLLDFQLEECPVHNIPKEIGDIIIKYRLNQQVSNLKKEIYTLEKRLKNK